jgi:hypothetical protein
MVATIAGLCAALFDPDSAQAASIPVTSCGQIVDGAGHLTADLTCPGSGHAVRLLQKGKLELGGFTLTATEGIGVSCFGKCRINGPGTIIAAAEGVSGATVQIKGASIAAGRVAGGVLKLKDTDFQQTSPAGDNPGATWGVCAND